MDATSSPPRRKSTRKRKTIATVDVVPEVEETVVEVAVADVKPKKGKGSGDNDATENKTIKEKTNAKAKAKPTNKAKLDPTPTLSPAATKPTTTETKGKQKKVTTKSKTKKAKVEPQKITDRDDLPKLWNEKDSMETNGSYTFKIISWNVAGLRAVLKNHPNSLPSLATRYDADVICLQETKLQEMHVTDPKLKIMGVLLEEEGYDAHYSCSTAKKGYSGTAVFVRRRSGSVVVEEEKKGSGAETKTKKRKQATLGNFFNATASPPPPPPSKPTKDDEDETSTPPPPPPATNTKSTGEIDPADLTPLQVTKQLGGDGSHDAEGRIITVDFPLFTLTNLYVPNSGQKLERLSYRTDSWDVDLLGYMQGKQKQTPVIWLGDLNVAHKALDVWNDGAKHLAKQAGITAEERASFQRQLDGEGEGEAGEFIDAYRHLHPEAKGHYSYWSQRAGNRAVNKGLRLDYFVCSRDLFVNDDEGVGNGGIENEKRRVLVRDCYMIPELLGSDHCPVVLELEIKKS